MDESKEVYANNILTEVKHGLTPFKVLLELKCRRGVVATIRMDESKEVYANNILMEVKDEFGSGDMKSMGHDQSYSFPILEYKTRHLQVMPISIKSHQGQMFNPTSRQRKDRNNEK
ncbi:hypothetical protein H6P81_017516 [Aristolochia fimbriata]|uniref:Uncharacterized protein n=1 Tax=Aristolochia fimbriata TaxID=158543 RepID=A0AAV7E1E9_ARIFI|nr:hypothetical protein H6P81_017516 [Aristolochia fimbriata]